MLIDKPRTEFKPNKKQNKTPQKNIVKNCWKIVKPVCSSTTRFRWMQDTQSNVGTAWSLDDIYVGESCPELCHSRGTCLNGKCFCERGYFGNSECHRILHTYTKCTFLHVQNIGQRYQINILLLLYCVF